MSAPEDLTGRGLALWEEMSDRFVLSESQKVTLHEACRMAMRLDELAGLVQVKGAGSSEARQARDTALAFTRMLAALNLADEHGRRVSPGRAPRAAYKPTVGKSTAKDRLRAV